MSAYSPPPFLFYPSCFTFFGKTHNDSCRCFLRPEGFAIGTRVGEKYFVKFFLSQPLPEKYFSLFRAQFQTERGRRSRQGKEKNIVDHRRTVDEFLKSTDCHSLASTYPQLVDIHSPVGFTKNLRLFFYMSCGYPVGF